MSDIDAARMTDAERLALFASFTKDITPAKPTRPTLAATIAPWVPALLVDRARGLDWKQLAAVCDQKLHIKITARALQRAVADVTRPTAANGTAAEPASTRRRVRHRARRRTGTTMPATQPAGTASSTASVPAKA